MSEQNLKRLGEHHNSCWYKTGWIKKISSLFTHHLMMPFPHRGHKLRHGEESLYKGGGGKEEMRQRTAKENNTSGFFSFSRPGERSWRSSQAHSGSCSKAVTAVVDSWCLEVRVYRSSFSWTHRGRSCWENSAPFVLTEVYRPLLVWLFQATPPCAG